MEETMPVNERALAFIIAGLGEELAELVSAGQVAEYSHEDRGLNELAQMIAEKLPEEVVRQVYSGNGSEEKLRLYPFRDITPDAEKILERVMQKIGFGETKKDNAVDVTG